MSHKHDIGILVLCLAFALASLGAVGGRGRTRAKEAVCRSHLQQWASVFEAFTLDNDGCFFSRDPSPQHTWWIDPSWSYHQDEGLLACPAATETSVDALLALRVWRAATHVGSYGINGWLGNPTHDTDVRGVAWQFWRTPRVWDPHNVPVLADMFWMDAWPLHTDAPSATEQLPAPDGTSEMQRACINRHDGAVNVLFADWSVRRVGLKELWTLKWSRQFNTAGPWTIAGGVTPADWPEWMRQFKDF